jgi:hypothetical protein
MPKKAGGLPRRQLKIEELFLSYNLPFKPIFFVKDPSPKGIPSEDFIRRLGDYAQDDIFLLKTYHSELNTYY